MPIEFLCSGCQNQLRVADETAGKQARCPNCSTVLTVPGSSQTSQTPGGFDFGKPAPSPFVPQQPASNPYSQPGIPQNPYASPSSSYDPPTAFSGGALSVQQMDVGVALSAAWNLLRLNAVVLIGAYFIQLVLSFGISFGFGIASGILGQVLQDPQHPAVMLVQMSSSVVNQLIQLWLAIGAILINLAVARGQNASIGMLFSGAPYLLRYIGAAIIFGIAMGVGFLLLIVPGIYVVLTYWSYMYFLVDRNCGVFESFQLAKTHASGNRLNSFVMFLLAAGLGMLGILACGIGLLVTAPLAFLTMVICYLMMTGQRYVEPTSPTA
jgi:uncharacterized membrane protein